MNDRTEAVASANSKFYRALSLADPAAMRGLWARSSKATCTHPGWHILTGFDSIQHSWAAIFVNQGPMHVWPSHVEITFKDELGRAECIENIDATKTSAGKIICVRATNVFCETAAGWKMLHHTAETAPGLEIQAANQRLAPN